MIKAALLDFDGTLVTADMSEVLANLAGQQEAVRQNNLNFHNGVTKGLEGLIASINLFKGLTLQQIEQELQAHDRLMPGAQQLMDYFRSHNIVTILASGSIPPVLEHYQQILGIDHVIGSPVRIVDDVIDGIDESDYSDPDFKLHASKRILKELGITAAETVAIGDSPGDKSRFLFAGHCIAINPKGDIERYADHTIHDDLSLAIPIIDTF
jgi:phosphoserine phosphatase